LYLINTSRKVSEVSLTEYLICELNYQFFFFSGPPGPPGGVRVEEIRDTAVALTWSRGTDNHSPISKYTIQSKTFLSEEWKDAKTGKSSSRINKINKF